MANEFKIRKGLIVEGASGGTVVDVQGSLGQLFSVTDNLTGEIFAVSDISGVPIMSINSSGPIKFGSYSGTNQTGTPTYMLGTTATGGVVKVLGADIPGVPGGSGTLNTIPLWTPDGDTLGDSTIKQDSNGNIGIGTGVITTPPQDIALTLQSTTTAVRFILKNSSTGIGASDGFRIGVLGTNVEFEAKDSSDFQFYTGASQVFTIKSTGKVGIGSTNPSRKFVVSNANASGIEIQPNYDTGVNEILSFDRTPGATAYETMRFNAGDFQFQIGGTEKMRINSVGNVGIDAVPETGMVTYIKQLRIGEQSALQGHQDGVGADSFTCVTTNWKFSTSGSVFINGTVAAPGFANKYQSQSGDHTFSCSTTSGVADGAITERIQVVMKQSGKVGIGATVPLAPLHVVTPAVGGVDLTDISRTANNLVRFTNPQYSTNATMGLLLRVFPDSDARQGAGLLMTGGTDNAASNLSLFVSKDDGTNSNISQSYSVLQAFGNTGLINLKVMAGHESQGIVRIGRHDTNTSRYNDIKSYVSSTAASNYLKFAVHGGVEDANVNVMTLLGNGDVGIGTSTPENKLEVVETTANTDVVVNIKATRDAYLQFSPASTTKWALIADYPAVGDFTTYNYPDNFNSIICKSNKDITTNLGGGNFGIATTNPASKLTVGGNATGFTTAMQVWQNGETALSGDVGGKAATFFGIGGLSNSSIVNIYSTAGYTIQAGGEIGFGGKYASGGQVAQYAKIRSFKTNALNGGINYGGGLEFWTRPNGSAAVPRMTILGDGKVGIGTTTPNAKLDIQGTQGQLFSVTDDLSGEIFAVADISGVPVMAVNSSGVSYFDGKLGIGERTPLTTLHLNDPSGSVIRLSSDQHTDDNKIEFDALNNGSIFHSIRSNTQTGNLQIRAGDGGSGHEVNIYTDGLFAASFDNNQRLGIGTESPTTPLHVIGIAQIVTSSDTAFYEGNGVRVFGSQSYNFRNSPGNVRANINVEATGANAGNLSLYNASNVVTTRLSNAGDSYLNGGNVGIKNTSPDKLLHVGGGTVASISDLQGAIIEGYNNTLDLRTKEGNSIADFTPALNLFCDGVVGSSGTGTGIYFRAKTGGGGGTEYTAGRLQGAVYTSWTTNTDATRTSKLVIQTTNSSIHADKVTILGTGATTFVSTVTATNFILSSDEALKENIKDISNKHIDVNWKNFELKSEPGIKRAGVIAQELEINHPEFVRTDEEGLKSVAYIDLLIAKIAELEARLEKAGI